MTTLYFVALAVTYLVNAAYFGTKLVALSNRESKNKNNAASQAANADMQPRCCL